MKVSEQKNQPAKDSEKILRKKKGVVVGDKLDKTIVVKVEEIKTHPRYVKKIRTSKKYKVHDEDNQYKVGDDVEFLECRPLSKDKKWKVA